MGLIREPKNVDFSVQSTPWTEEELTDFRKLMTELKVKNVRQNFQHVKVRKKVLNGQILFELKSPPAKGVILTYDTTNIQK